MRNTLTWAVVVGVALAATGTASAQGRRGLGGLFGGGMLGGAAGGIQLLSNASVQEELKLTDEQKNKLRDFAEQQQAKAQERMQQAQKKLEQAKRKESVEDQQAAREDAAQSRSSGSIHDSAPSHPCSRQRLRRTLA